MTKSKRPVAWDVDVEFWGLEIVKVKAKSKSEAKAIVRKRIREGKLCPKVQSIDATRAPWRD